MSPSGGLYTHATKMFVSPKDISAPQHSNNLLSDMLLTSISGLVRVLLKSILQLLHVD